MAGQSRNTAPKSSASSSTRAKDRAAKSAAPSVDPPRVETEPSAPADGNALKTPRRIALDAAFRGKEDVRLGLTEHLRQARIQGDRLDARVEVAFRNFRPIQRAAQTPDIWHQVEPGSTPLETVRQVMHDRLSTLNAAPPGSGIAIRPESPLIQWGGNGPGEVGATSGSIELSALMGFMDTHGGSVLARPNTTVAACKAERQAQAMLDDIEMDMETLPQVDSANAAGGGAPGEAPVEGDPRRSEKVAAFVERAVDTQMAPATAPEARLAYGLIPNGANSQEAQAHLLTTFQLRPGPTDVTAYHDFSTLQIAFEHVWTRIFDGELEALGRQLYREYVDLKDFLGYDPATADRPISSLDDLTWLIGEIRTLSQLAQDAIPPSNDRAPLGTASIPRGSNDIAKEATEFVESLPGGRVGTAVGTLGISELVLWFMNEAENFGKKTSLRWDDLVNGWTLQRGDRILASVTPAVVTPGSVALVLRTDISNKKEVAFQVFDQASRRFQNLVRVSNAAGRTIIDSAGRPEFYEHEALIPTSLLATGLLEFASQEGWIVLGRYVMGDLDKIVPDRARLTLYWKDR